MADTLVIVPTYNEIQTLEAITQRIVAAVPDADVLIVDDASPDGTGSLADRLSEADGRIVVLHRQQKDGLGHAYLAGFAHALDGGYDFVVEIDADGSHDPAELPAMLALARDDAALVIGSRWVPGGSIRDWPWIRQAISRTGNRYARFALRSGIRDITAGYRVYRTGTLRTMHLETVSSQGYCFQVEMAWRAERSGEKIAEHPIEFVERQLGASKMHAGIVAEALLRVTGWGIADRIRRPRLARASLPKA
jgi:dolichol-phosphate mannosyltransferase